MINGTDIGDRDNDGARSQSISSVTENGVDNQVNIGGSIPKKKDSNSRETTTQQKHNRRPSIQNNNDMILQKVGYIVEEFKCSHNNFQGILYVGPLAVVFLGRMLLFEWTVVVKWEDVQKVNHCVEKGYKDGIRIDACQPGSTETTKYYFERFFDSNKALGVLISLHNDSILDLTSKAMPTPNMLSRGLRRNNSDPLRISNLFNFDDDAMSLQQANDAFQEAKNDSIRSTLELQFSGSEEEKSARLPQQSGLVLHRTATYSFSPESAQVLHIPINKEVFENDRIGHTITTAPTTTTASVERSSKQLQEAWQIVLRDDSYSETVIQDLELACDLDTFLQKFVWDDAPYSISSFMKSNGDKDIQASKWKKEKQASQESFSRTIEYTHPVDAPMAPPMARARKEQTYALFGGHGLIFSTKTFVSDVPMTDCFYVADRIRVENKNIGKVDSSTPPCISVSIAFEVRFVKSTMFRGIISRTTKNELEKFCHSLAGFLQQRLGSAAGDSGAPSVPSVQQLRQSAVMPRASVLKTIDFSRWMNASVFLLLVIFVCLQSWMVWETRMLRLETQRQTKAFHLLLESDQQTQGQQPRLKMVYGDNL